MGLFDYENLKNTIHPYKKASDVGISYLEYMSKNKNWVDENSKWLDPSDPIVSLLNRTVLKATPLRGEIYFITCKCYKLDGSYNYFTFVVNEYTIYKRFRIYKSKTEPIEYFYKGNATLQEYVNYLKTPNNYRITMKLFNNENTSLKSIFENLENDYVYNYYLDWEIRDGMILEPININHFNKRTWLFLLQNHNDINLDLDYKSESSVAYYDGEFAKQYN